MTKLVSIDDYIGEGVGAAYRRGREYIGEYLYFDETGITFDSSPSSSTRIGPIRIDYRDIVGLETYRLLGLRNNGLMVSAADGTQHRIAVNKRSSIVEFVTSKIPSQPS